MKKLKCRLERRICDILSAIILWCDGRGCFKISSLYRFSISERFFLEIGKEVGPFFSYLIVLKREGIPELQGTIVYDIMRKDVPIQRAYTIRGLIMKEQGIVGRKLILDQLKEDLKRK
jgi:hypothetical protein